MSHKYKTPYPIIFDKPRLLFILLGVRNECALKYFKPAFEKAFPKDKVFYYTVWEHHFPESTNWYQSWFTDLMIKKGSSEVVVVIHDENMDLMAEIFDERMKTFHAIYNYVIVKTEFRKSHVIVDPEHPFNVEEYDKYFAGLPDYFWDLYSLRMQQYQCDVYTGSLSSIKDDDYSDLDKRLNKIKKYCE